MGLRQVVHSTLAVPVALALNMVTGSCLVAEVENALRVSCRSWLVVGDKYPGGTLPV